MDEVANATLGVGGAGLPSPTSWFSEGNALWSYVRIALFAAAFRLFDYPLLYYAVGKVYGQSSARRRWRIRNETTSLVHATVSGAWALTTFALYHDVWSDMIGWYRPLAYWLILFTTGYLSHDALDLLVHERSLRTLELLFHHAAVAFALVCSVATYRFTAICACGLLMEVNSAFLHARSLLNLHAVDRQSVLYRLVSVTNVATFIVFRLATTFYLLVWDLLHYERMPRFYFGLLFFVMFSLMCVNLILFYRVLLADAYVQPPPAGCLVPPPVWQYLPALRTGGGGAAQEAAQLDDVQVRTGGDEPAGDKRQPAEDEEAAESRSRRVSRESAYMSAAGDVIMGTGDIDVIP